jgi:hypothetical protein
MDVHLTARQPRKSPMVYPAIVLGLSQVLK